MWLVAQCLLMKLHSHHKPHHTTSHTETHTQTKTERSCECILYQNMALVKLQFGTLHALKFYCTKSLYSIEWLNGWLSLSWSLLLGCSHFNALSLWHMLITIASLVFFLLLIWILIIFVKCIQWLQRKLKLWTLAHYVIIATIESEREIGDQSTQRAFGCAFKMHFKSHRITIFESNSLESKANAECIQNKSLLWACEIKCRLAHKYIIKWQSATKCRCIEINNEFIFIAFVYALHSPTSMSVSLDYVAHFA